MSTKLEHNLARKGRQTLSADPVQSADENHTAPRPQASHAVANVLVFLRRRDASTLVLTFPAFAFLSAGFENLSQTTPPDTYLLRVYYIH